MKGELQRLNIPGRKLFGAPPAAVRNAPTSPLLVSKIFASSERGMVFDS
jgi:hypothetical protein